MTGIRFRMVHTLIPILVLMSLSAACLAAPNRIDAKVSQNPIPKEFTPTRIMPSERDALDSLMTSDEQWETGAEKLPKEERQALAKVLLRVYALGQQQQYIVVSSYGTFTAGLAEFTGSSFIFDISSSEIQRLKRNQPTLEWLPDGKLVLYPYQVTWLRR